MTREFRPAPKQRPRTYRHPGRRPAAVGAGPAAAPVPPKAVIGVAASDLGPGPMLQRIAEAMPDILYVFDLLERRNRYANRRIEQVLGYPPEQVAAMGDDVMRTLVHPDDMPAVATHLERLGSLAEHELATIEYRMRHADGGYRWLRSREVPFARTADGQVAQVLGVATDVTEHRQMLDALREGEARFRAIAEAVPGFVLTSRPGHGCDYVSPWFHGYTGLPPGAAEGDGWTAALHPEDGPRVQAAWREAEAAGKSFEDEYRFRSADGSYRWFAVRKRPVRDASGSVLKWVGTGTDIDGLKRAHASLERANARLQGVLDGISERHFTLDRAWRVTSANRMAADWTGAGPGDLVGRAFLRLFPRLAGSGMRRGLREAFETGRPSRWEAPSPMAPGQWVEIQILPSAEGVSVFVRDITGRKAAEIAARETREVLQSTLDSLAAHVAILDRDGVILAVNAAWRRFAGTGTAGVGSGYAEAFAAARPGCEASAPAVAAGLHGVAGGERGEFRLGHACDFGGKRRWFQLRATCFGEGEDLRLVVSQEEITEVKRAEEELRRLTGHLLSSQDEERRRIARELHDSTVPNLVGAELGIAGALRTAAGIPAEGRVWLEESRILVARSHNEIRTLSYILHPPMLDEGGLPLALRWYAEGFARRSGMAVHVEVSRAFGRRRARPEAEMALFRVAQEALANAHRHSGGSTIWIRLGVTRAGAMEGGAARGLVVTIRDDGRGPPPHFLRAHDGQTSVASAGVGLPGMRERLGHLGGRLSVEPARGGGTVIRADVPVAGTPPARGAARM